GLQSLSPVHGSRQLGDVGHVRFLVQSDAGNPHGSAARTTVTSTVTVISVNSARLRPEHGNRLGQRQSLGLGAVETALVFPDRSTLFEVREPIRLIIA
ncbi:hypothetical protein MKL09_05945, partial [Methylobacterium sp. J-048]|uniref:hypothetical protein n=1 Tax=Methylobacterium sp. J-048 TaxID=2836635 RepID=UPI001FB966BB